MTFEGIRSEGLGAESRMLLNMQLARFCLHNDQREQAYQHVRLILRENALNTPWSVWGAVFNLCMPLFQFMTSEYPRVSADQVDEDLIILSISYLKLLSLYLDMRDYDAADDFFQHLLQSIHQPIDYALILAAQGAIAAENKHFATAFTHFMNALQYLEHVDEPLLRLALHTLVMRTAHVLARDDEVCQHLFEALVLAAAAETKAAMVQLLVFCSELPLATSHYELTQYIRETVDNLQAQSPGNERSASQETLQSIAERVIAMTTGC
jgi:tetratricopeptide (TPR) repeat protein